MNFPFVTTRLRNRAFIALSAYPLAWIIFFYLLVVRARLQLGTWPAAYHPDSKELGFTFHQQAIWWGLVAMPLVGLGVLAIAFIGRSRPLCFRVWALALLAGSLVLLIVLARFDPGDFFIWFAD